MAKVLKEKGHTVWGIESSGQALEMARAHLERGYQLDVTESEWPSELMSRRFDVIIASEIIEHLFDPEPFIRRLLSLLASGGSLIVTTPNFLFWKNRLRMLGGKFQYEQQGILDFGHIRFFTLATARQLLNRVGLKVKREHHYYPNLEHRGLGRFGRFFPGIFAYQLIFQAARKDDTLAGIDA